LGAISDLITNDFDPENAVDICIFRLSSSLRRG